MMRSWFNTPLPTKIQEGERRARFGKLERLAEQCTVNTANRSAVVRFHGYNNEEEMKERDLMESSGKDKVEQQIEQARLDIEDYEEDAGNEQRQPPQQQDCQAPTDTNDRHEQAVGQSSTASKNSTCVDICCVDTQVQLRTGYDNILLSPQTPVDTVAKSSKQGDVGNEQRQPPQQ